MGKTSPRNPVKGPTEESFPPWEQINEGRHDHPLEFCFGYGLFHIAEIGIGAYNGLGFGVIGNILEIIGGIDGGDRYGNGSSPLEAEPTGDPLDGIGDVQDHPVPFADA